MANLLVEVGNTALKAALAEGMTLGKAFRFQGEKVMEFILSLTEKEKPEVMAVVSAKPVTPEEEAALKKECRHLMILDSAHHDILQRYDLPDYLSYDRAASLLAVRYLFKGKPCIVFDFGTTLTIDLTGEDGQYHGGNVSPGLLTRFKALSRYSKSLPQLNIPNRIPREGNSLESSI